MVGGPGKVDNRQIISLLKISANGVASARVEPGHTPTPAPMSFIGVGVERRFVRFPSVARRLAGLEDTIPLGLLSITYWAAVTYNSRATSRNHEPAPLAPPYKKSRFIERFAVSGPYYYQN